MLGSALPQRVIMGIMGFLAIVVSFLMRGCLSVAITEMVVPFCQFTKILSFAQLTYHRLKIAAFQMFVFVYY